MGGFTAQIVALNAPNLVRKLVLAGTAPSGNPNFLLGSTEIINEYATASTYEECEHATAAGLFPADEAVKDATKESWKRMNERQIDRAPFLDKNGTSRQLEALANWQKPNDLDNSFDRLPELKMPVFVAAGARDIFFPSSNSCALFRKLGNAAGHGFLYQHADSFVAYLIRFLDE